MTDPVNAEDDLVEAVARAAIDRAIGRLRKLHDYTARPAWDQVVAEEIRAALEAVRSTRDGEIERLKHDFDRLAKRERDAIYAAYVAGWQAHRFCAPRMEVEQCWAIDRARQALNQGTGNVG